MQKCNQDKIIMHYMTANAAGAVTNYSAQQLLIAHHEILDLAAWNQAHVVDVPARTHPLNLVITR